MPKINNNIISLRAANNITQIELAKALKVSRQTIINIETYCYNPSLELAFKISKYFNQPLEKIFNYKKE